MDPSLVAHGAVVSEPHDNLGDGGSLLSDGDVNTVEIGLLVAPGVDYGVHGHGGFASDDHQ